MWLSIFAYTIRIAAKLGLVKTEPATPKERAYLRAHEGMHWLRLHISGAQVEETQEQRVIFSRGGVTQQIECRDSQLWLGTETSEESPLKERAFVDPRGASAFDLGPGGSATFSYSERKLSVSLIAGDDSLGEIGTHQAHLSFPAPLRPNERRAIQAEFYQRLRK